MTNETMVRFLGSAFIEVDGKALTGAVAQRHPLALLALLARAPSRQLSRDKVVGYLWPESSASLARHRLRDTLLTVRRTLGAQVVLSVGDDLRLNAEVIGIDVVEFEVAIVRGDFETAVRTYHGPFLDGFYLKDSESFERWVEAERNELAEAHMAALRQLAVTATSEGRSREAVNWWQRLTKSDPYDSDAALGLMRALADAGDPAGALRHAKVHAVRLADDLGAVPSADLQALEHALQAAPPDEPSPATEPATVLERPIHYPIGQSPPVRIDHRLVRFGLALAVILSLILALSHAGRRVGKPETPVDANRIAVFPFTTQGDDTYSYLEQGLVDLLSVKLALPGQTRTIDPKAILAQLGPRHDPPPPDVASLGRLAARLGAGTFVQGTIVGANGDVQIIASLYTQGRVEPRVVAQVSLTEEAALFDAVDRLCRQLLSGWLGRGGADYLKLAGLTTNSLPAFKAYLAGERALRQGRHQEAVAQFDSATGLDPDFALAYYRVSVAANWAGHGDLVVSGAEEAWHRREGLPERVRLLLQARYGFYTRSLGLDEALGLLRQVLADYPDDVEALYEFADIRFHHAPRWGLGAPEVRAGFEQVLVYDPGHVGALSHLIRIVAHQRDHTALDTLVERTLALVEDGRQRREIQALAAFSRGDSAAEDAVLEHIEQLDDWSLYPIVAVTLTFSENPTDALRLLDLFQQVDRSAPTKAFGIAWAASVEAARGRLTAARAMLDRWEPLDPLLFRTVGLLIELTSPITDDIEALARARDRLADVDRASFDSAGIGGPFPAISSRANTLFLLGLASARVGDTTMAFRLINELEGQHGDTLVTGALATVAKAAAAHWAGNPDEALRLLQGTDAAPFRDWQAFLKAEALLASGKLEESLQWYATLPTDFSFGILFAAQSHLRMAQTYQRLQRPLEGESHLQRAAELWREGDAAFRALLRNAIPSQNLAAAGN